MTLYHSRLFGLSLVLALAGMAPYHAAVVQAAEPQPATKQLEPRKSKAMSITKKPYGTTENGQPISEFTLTNNNGLVVRLITYGAIVTSVETPDRDGARKNITLGFDSLAGYEQRHPYFGATVGRFCNRIAGGKFELDGKQYTLATNNGPNHLHGGLVGFDKVVWQAEPIEAEDLVGVRFTYRSKDGEEGYPGNLDASATYSLKDASALKIEFTAASDQATPVNLTNHNYWNLAGAGSGTILDHQLMIAADKYLPVDESLIPTGELAEVKGTPVDFTKPKAIRADLKKIEAEPRGYDHCFALRGQDGKLNLAARVKDPASGRIMEIHTTQPGIQLYSGNFLDGSAGGNGFNQYEGFCLETQHYPDSPNQPNFPSTILKPGETYRQVTVHRFTVE